MEINEKIEKIILRLMEGITGEITIVLNFNKYYNSYENIENKYNQIINYNKHYNKINTQNTKTTQNCYIYNI